MPLEQVAAVGSAEAVAHIGVRAAAATAVYSPEWESDDEFDTVGLDTVLEGPCLIEVVVAPWVGK